MLDLFLVFLLFYKICISTTHFAKFGSTLNYSSSQTFVISSIIYCFVRLLPSNFEPLWTCASPLFELLLYADFSWSTSEIFTSYVFEGDFDHGLIDIFWNDIGDEILLPSSFSEFVLFRSIVVLFPFFLDLLLNALSSCIFFYDPSSSLDSSTSAASLTFYLFRFYYNYLPLSASASLLPP